MKRTILIAGFLATFLIAVWSCSPPQKEERKSVQTEKAPESKPTKTVAKKNTGVSSETADRGKKLFNDNGCLACHQLNTKLVGPSLKDISMAYTGNKEGLAAFLRGNGDAIVDPAQEALMQPQIPITQAMSDEELNAVVDYILSAE